jgi:hypothetical protein
MREGTLSYDFGSERYEIAFDDGGSRRELHCGDTFQNIPACHFKSPFKVLPNYRHTLAEFQQCP